MHNTAVRDRTSLSSFVTLPLRWRRSPILQDEPNSSPMKGGLPMDGGTGEYAPRPPAGASLVPLEAEPALSAGRRPLGAVRSRAMLRCRLRLPTRAQRMEMMNGLCRTSLSSGHCPALCPARDCTRGSWSRNGV